MLFTQQLNLKVFLAVGFFSICSLPMEYSTNCQEEITPDVYEKSKEIVDE